MARNASRIMTTTKPRQRPSASSPADTSPEALLARAQASREVIQDFVPLSESMEWRLGQEYLRQRGNKAFLSDAHPVPFVINNDGALSHHAAAVLFAALQAADKQAPLPNDLFVLELGIGVGLFARYCAIRSAGKRPRSRPVGTGIGLCNFSLVRV